MTNSCKLMFYVIVMPSCFQCFCLKQIRVNLRNPWLKKVLTCFVSFGYKYKFTINFR